MADFTTLLDLLKGGVAYDNSWAVYAQKVDGMFTPGSPARLGQPLYENGGLLDDYSFFMRNADITDYLGSWERENITYYVGQSEEELITSANLEIQE